MFKWEYETSVANIIKLTILMRPENLVKTGLHITIQRKPKYQTLKIPAEDQSI